MEKLLNAVDALQSDAIPPAPGLEDDDDPEAADAEFNNGQVGRLDALMSGCIDVLMS